MVEKTPEGEEIYPAQEQWEQEKDPDEKRLQRDLGEAGEEIYDRGAREQLLEDGEISAWEEGFMEGAEKGGKDAKCVFCGELLSQSKADLVEKEIDGKLLFFCCDEHVAKYEER